MSTVIERVIEVFSETTEDWRQVFVLGSEGNLVAGYAGRQAQPANCNPGWFAGDSTLILGVEAKPDDSPPLSVEVEWQIVVPPEAIQEAHTAFLIMGAKRVFGGLHSSVRGADVEVLVNGHSKDAFTLDVVPPPHDDYFHRPPLPEGMPRIAPFDRCGTVYAWPVEKTDLDARVVRQVVRVRIAPDVSWDVDYIAILLAVPRRHVRGAVWRALEWFAAGIVGALATKLLG